MEELLFTNGEPIYLDDEDELYKVLVQTRDKLVAELGEWEGHELKTDVDRLIESLTKLIDKNAY